MRALAEPRRRSRLVWAYGATGGVVIVGLVIALVIVLGRSGSANTPSPTGAASPSSGPVLAAVPTGVTGEAIDGIQCEAMEQVAYHIHTHLAIYSGTTREVIPEGIGIPEPRTEIPTDDGPFVQAGKCYYWLHTHTDDGIIHIESPTQRLYTLGQFFDIWQQPLSSTEVGPDSGTLTVYVNGAEYSGNPRSIPLTLHELIQIDVNSSEPPQPFTFPAGL
ncbi:MAG: hypothetical protein JOZ92_04575 [Candidatus Dormibacteraeota bacterium]|nr:hypothetical protein [Candidatus Dormibacteraeota bacterium]